MLSLVDALAPSVVVALATLFLVSDSPVERTAPFLWAGGAGTAVFVWPLTAGFVATLRDYGPFPATRTTKRL